MAHSLRCAATATSLSPENSIALQQIRKPLRDYIRQKYPELPDNGVIDSTLFNTMRRLYLEDLIRVESKELSTLEADVLRSIHSDEILAKTIREAKEPLTLGQRLADKIAFFGGSWTFISLFFLFILCWMAVNVIMLAGRPFDPYPFILLNLILSCLAAIQAPIIMMSQNRQEQKDRQRSEHDYMVNLKAELEIRLLHEKMDHLIVHQIQRLLEIQQLQMDYLEEISGKKA